MAKVNQAFINSKDLKEILNYPHKWFEIKRQSLIKKSNQN